MSSGEVCTYKQPKGRLLILSQNTTNVQQSRQEEGAEEEEEEEEEEQRGERGGGDCGVQHNGAVDSSVGAAISPRPLSGLVCAPPRRGSRQTPNPHLLAESRTGFTYSHAGREG